MPMIDGKVKKCRACGADIIWMSTIKGNQMPVDWKGEEDNDPVFDHTRHVSHFATCPNASDFRKKRYGKQASATRTSGAKHE